MGQYNPHAPYILGQEWVPIRNAHYVSDGVVERGYAFTLDATTVPVSGAFYVEKPPENNLRQACEFISIYPAGRETLTGPVKRLRVRPSAIAVTNAGSIDISNGVAALYTPEDSLTIIFDADTGIASQLQVSFDIEQYAAILLGKRILDVRLRYVFLSTNLANSENLTFRIHNQNAFSGVIFPDVTEVQLINSLIHISELSITELNPTWNMGVIFRGQRTVLPWRFQELNRFRAGAPAASALTVFIQNDTEIFPAFLSFLEMEIIYCEETRVLYGGFRTYDNSFVNFPALIEEYYGVGALAVQLYSPTTFTPGATLPKGDYVVTVYHRDMASRSIYQGAPRLHALRQYYELSNQRGVHVHQTLEIDSQFTSERTDVLTQLTLHTATQIVTGSHPYGTQYGAPVYGSRFANQEIEDDPAPPVSTPFPQVRFYARRYGHTTMPLTLADVATGTHTVAISVAEFDALAEIVDGWREVTLRFDSPPSFQSVAGALDWRWTSAGELTGNQWQVMVADGPTGAWQPNPNAAATGPATYWAPFGDTVTLTWQSPSVSGVANDTTSDAVLIFSQDPPSVTGFALEIDDQQLDVALACAAPPGCVPTALDYAHLEWTPFGICDAFDRILVDDWGDTDTNQTYTYLGGTIPDDYDVADGWGTHTIGSINVTRNSIAALAASVSSLISASWGGFDAQVTVRADQISTGGTIQGRIMVGTDNVNGYETYLYLNTDSTVSLQLSKIVAGVVTFLPLSSSIVTIGQYGVDSRFSVRMRWLPGGFIAAKAWNVLNPEPAGWQLQAIDTTLTSFTELRLRSRAPLGNTNVNPTVSYADLVLAPAALTDGTLELQRRDAYSDDWQTIMLATRPACVYTYDDYEARVGVLSEYRIRTLNALNFAGPWVTGSATIPAPGVTVAGDASSILIFTSNAQPSSNLAYTMNWQNEPVETFSFPEADFVALQRLFGRDFYLAVRPLERGGERFTRTLLVNNAAIALPSLANFHGLRDLAWADLDYVCVRDELGNRWFATILVPDGEVRGDRTIYLARVDVIKATNTPTPIDPA